MVHSEGVHEIARTGFGNGTNDLYDRSARVLLGLFTYLNLLTFLLRARPSYPSDALKYIRQEVVVPDSLDIVEYYRPSPRCPPVKIDILSE
jgi:hypothetical protein